MSNMKRRFVAAALFFFTLFVSTYAAEDQFSGVSNSQTTGLCAQLIRPAGYPCTEHTVIVYYWITFFGEFWEIWWCSLMSLLLVIEVERKYPVLRYLLMDVVYSSLFIEMIFWWMLQAHTEDGFLLGLQRVSSRSSYIRGQSGPPVLLLHGLAMVIPLMIPWFSMEFYFLMLVCYCPSDYFWVLCHWRRMRSWIMV